MAHWYEKDGASWSDEDRVMASDFLEKHRAEITDPDPFGVVRTATFNAAWTRYSRGMRYKGARTPDAFLDYAALHLGTLKRILIRDASPAADTPAVAPAESSRAALERWLREDQVPRRRLAAIAARHGHPASGADTFIFLFSRSKLGAVVTKVDVEGFSGWDYLAYSFDNFLKEQDEEEDTDDRPGNDIRDPGASPEILADRLSEEALTGRRTAAVLGEVARWRAEEARKPDHLGTLDPTCTGCRSVLVAQLYAGYLAKGSDDEHGVHKKIAEELRITEVNARVTWHRARLKLRNALRRVPVRLTSDDGGRAWRIHLDDYALSDTMVEIQCEPRDVAHADVATLPIPAGVASSIESFVLHRTPAPTTRVTAIAFARQGKPGGIVPCEIRFDQARLTVSASGTSLDEWVTVPPLTPAAASTSVRLAASAPVRCVVAGAATPLPATLALPPGETTLRTEIIVPLGAPGLARIDVHPNPVVGGDPITVTLWLGLLVAAEASGYTVEGFLPVASRLPVALELTSPAVDFEASMLPGHGASRAVEAHTRPVSQPEAVDLLGRAGDAEIHKRVDLLPQPPSSIEVYDSVSAGELDVIPAGATVHVVVGFRRRVPIDIDVDLCANHSGLVIEQPHGVVRRNEAHARFVVRAGDAAKSGPARLTARTAGGEFSRAMVVEKNALASLEFQKKEVFGGAQITATVSSRHPVGGDVVLQVSSSDGGLVHVSSASGLDGQQAGPVRIPRGSRSVTFYVSTGGVTRRHPVRLTVNGFGETISGVLTLKPQPRPRMDQHG